MDVDLYVEYVTTLNSLPSEQAFKEWVTIALAGRRESAEVAIRVVDEAESQQLNNQYRQKNKPTNVLSFPAQLLPGVEETLLGDLVICAPIVIAEAHNDDIPLLAHWAHLTIHGTLHLLGYDHIKDDEAEIMEQLEIQLLAQLGYANPYD